MARPITMKALDEIVERGAMLQFVGVGSRGKGCDYWIAVALPFEDEEQAFVLVAYNNPNIRTLRHKAAIDSIIERYPGKQHIQTMLLPLGASIEKPEDIYLMSRREIEQLDPPPVIRRRPILPES